MAYLEIRRGGKAVSRRRIEEAEAHSGRLIHLKSGEEVRLAAKPSVGDSGGQAD